MQWSLLSTKHNINNLDSLSNSIRTSSEIHTTTDNDNEEYHWHELTISNNDSLLTSLNRICFYWRQIIFNKIRCILTLVFVTMFNIASRLPCFTRHKKLVRPTSPLPASIATLSPMCTLEEDINHSPTSFRKFNSQLDLPSLENSTMARMLVQQQTHRTRNISLHQPITTENESLLTMSHSADDRVFYYQPDSASFWNFIQRFASEPQMSMCRSTSDGFSNQNLPTSVSSNTFSPLNQVKEEQEEVNHINCDTIQPIITPETKSETLDSIVAATMVHELDEDILLNTNSSLNAERHFRRRKRRSLLAQSSLSFEEEEPIKTDVIEDINNNQEKKSEEISENVQPVSIESLSLNENNEKKEDISVENKESNDSTTPANRLRGRRLRFRSYRDTSSTSSEPIPDNPVKFFVPTETSVSPPPSPPSPPSSPISPPSSPISPPSSPVSPTATTPIYGTCSNTLPGGLKRIGSAGTTKKMVRFADSVGRELAQVQYIQSSQDEDTKELKRTKNNLYVSATFNGEHKPWSFDVALTPKQIPDTRIPKRFFCLYRQPNSEHPDIYLHEIWRSQIKLEHADIRSKSSSTGEQYLYGTVWVTNAGYWKNVTVKYSFNRWLNTYEYEAQHRCHSNDFRNIDQFEFSIDIPQDVDRIDFVLRYNVNGQEHWDNNEGKNYTLETESASTPQTIISLPHDCDFNEMRFY